MKKTIAIIACVLFAVLLTGYAYMQPSSRDMAIAHKMYIAKINGDKDQFVYEYGRASDKAINVYREMMAERQARETMAARKRAQAEKLFNE